LLLAVEEESAEPAFELFSVLAGPGSVEDAGFEPDPLEELLE